MKSYLIIIGSTLLCLILFFRRQSRRQPRKLCQVDSECQIRTILEQSIIERQAYEIVVELQETSSSMTAVPMELTEKNTLLVELLDYGSELTKLRQLPLTVYFRVGHGQGQQFFYFNTSASGIIQKQIGRVKHRLLSIAIPSCLHQGQKRRHYRLQPAKAARVCVSLRATGPAHRRRQRLMLQNAPVDDISAGGLSFTSRDLPAISELGKGDVMVLEVSFQPCCFESRQARVPATIFFQAELLGNRLIKQGRRRLRFRFLSRQVDAGYGKSYFSDDLDRLNEDLSRWIHECQRMIIKQRRLAENLEHGQEHRRSVSQRSP
ncbi:MAG: hypothetical protein JRJ12_05640 [Deltaproteobacteria bacterium]|nr:hypothetical protein [Deltaproteobacteria bacterium]MBW2069694.1 hypothetical protein [Deltaproteobacteria bacterium]